MQLCASFCIHTTGKSDKIIIQLFLNPLKPLKQLIIKVKVWDFGFTTIIKVKPKKVIIKQLVNIEKVHFGGSLSGFIK